MIKRLPHFLITLCFIIIFTDSLMNYFLKSVYKPLPVNTLAVPIFAAAVMIGGPKVVLPNIKVLLWLFCAVLGFLIGILSVDDITYLRFFEIATALVAFFVGYAFIINNDDENFVSRIFLILVLLYVIICLLALSRQFPSVFPIIDKIWSKNGSLQIRPEVTTDQNFQIFYLFPAGLIMALPFRWPRFLLASFAIISSLFILAKLQTRSGTLLMAGTLFAALISPMFIRSLGRRKVLVLPVVGFIAFTLSLPYIIQSADLLIYRFVETDYSTGLGRLYSFLYLFETVWNPINWIPKGNAAYVAATGNVPHSNVTAFFLEGGILALAAWFALIFVPLIRMGLKLLRGRLSHLSTVAFLGCLTMFVTQMSLNVAMIDQIWLWAGIGIGTCVKEKYRVKELSKITGSSPHPLGNTIVNAETHPHRHLIAS